MSIVGPILIAAATLTSAGSPGRAPSHVSPVAATRLTLSDAVYAAARSELLRVDQRQQVSLRPGRTARRGPARRSIMTRATAVVAGAVIGSLAGVAGGAVFDLATSNGECLTGMAVGMPVGAILGGVLTARLVR